MEKRKSIIQKFSSFICLKRNNQHVQFTWKVDLMLKKEMQLKQEVDPDGREDFWFQYFLKVLLGFSHKPIGVADDLHLEESVENARKHLSAYLQEACWKSAQDIHHELQYIQHKYSLEDYFQIANIAAGIPGQIFKSFQFERNKINIEAYAIAAFKRFIRNYLYQQDLEARRTRFSQYGLLKNLSARELNDALLAQNISSQQIMHYCLLWQCFNEVFPSASSGHNRQKSPSSGDFVVIGRYYEQRCKQLNIQALTNFNKTIEELLKDCIYAARNYRSKQYISFDEKYDNLADFRFSTWDNLEREEEWKQLHGIIDKLFLNMPQLCKTMFQLRLGLQLTQTEIANIIKFKHPELQKQYQVARQFQRYTRDIFRSFVREWNQININSGVLLDGQEEVEKIQAALEECLQRYCRQKLFLMFDSLALKSSDDGHLFSSGDVGMITTVVASTRITSPSLELLQQEIECKLDLSTNSLSIVSEKLVALVNEWINFKKLG